MADRKAHALARMISRGWHWLSPDAWQRTVARIVAVTVLVAAGGFVFISLGLTPIAADEGHWRITERFLRYTMSQSVRIQSFGTKVPPLDDASLVLKGAGHYATDCAPCHGAPGQPRALAVEHMVPIPPDLVSIVDDWKPHQLHWIVKHGIKYTAMPAWPTQQRDDEVWAMVAFLRRLPDMDAAEFRRLAYGPASPSPASVEGTRLSTLQLPPLSLLENCARCHGADGEGRGDGAIPRLAGQYEPYLLATLKAYAKGERHSGIMQPVAAGLDAGQMNALARHYASMTLPADKSADTSAATGRDNGGSDVDRLSVTAGDASNSLEAARARGAALADSGLGHQRIPACRQCHGPGAGDYNPSYPRLTGQHPHYLASQLRLFQQGRRGGTRYLPLMHRAAAALSEQQVADLAIYYGLLDEDVSARDR